MRPAPELRGRMKEDLDTKTIDEMLVEHPSHYISEKSEKYECIDVMKDVFGDEAVENFSS